MTQHPYHIRDVGDMIQFPYAITQDLLVVPSKMVDVTMYKIRRDELGSYEYWLPETGEVLLLLETLDGLIVLIWEKKD